jgi:hypothetical protein
MAHFPAALDHLVYATPVLEQSLDQIEKSFGVRPLSGGRHPAWGTRNAILPLGPSTYLEIIGPEPGARPEIFGLPRLTAPRLVTWAAKGRRLTALTARALTHGIDLGLPRSGSRTRPDGLVLTWELTDPSKVSEGGLIPFFIDWGDSPHPASTEEARVQLQNFHAEHPEPAVLLRKLQSLDLDLPVQPGREPRLVATFRTPRGLATLR